jgi:hypothetical protein
MSHHLDSPIARQDIRLDITDLYVFRGETGTVFVIDLCHSIFGPIPAPGYHPGGMYEFKIDLNGDAISPNRRLGGVHVSDRRRRLALDQSCGSAHGPSAIHPVQRRPWQSP